MNLKRFFLKAGDAKLSDYLAVFPMLVGLLLSPFYRNKYRNTWGICERRDEARDNAYHFYKFIATEHPEQKCIYAIDKKCNDYMKVCDLGETVQFGSLKHWILYFTCKYLISSQAFMPNGYVCTFIERARLFRPGHVFLQHGITKDMAEFLLASHRTVKYFIAGAKPEYEFMKENFGYPHGTMKYTGFARFDMLHGYHIIKNRIIIMPTWRKWLKLKSEAHDDAKTEIETSEYLLEWKNLLKSKKLENLAIQYNLEIIFYPHPNMRGILNPENIVGSNVKIANILHDDLQELLKTAQLLITDYSSVFFDVAYMKKPIIFYQFDEKKYRNYHYQQGWYDYHNTSLGKSCKNADEVLINLEEIIQNGYKVTKDYLVEHKKIFPLYDTDNCKRIYEVMIGNK